MNKRGFTLYVTLIYMLLICSICSVLIMNIATYSYLPNLYEQLNENNQENINLLNCVKDIKCTKKIEIKTDQKQVLEYLNDLDTLIIEDTEFDDMLDEIMNISGEDIMWIIKSEYDVLIGKDKTCIYRLLIHEKKSDYSDFFLRFSI